jgi:hypothetical protein
MRVGIVAFAVFVLGGCVGRTGGETVQFPVAAAGPADAVAGQRLSFTTTLLSGAMWQVVLTRATLHIGAVYLDQSAPVSGGQATGCYLTGTYVAEETSTLDVDLLDPSAQRFPALARGITEPPALIGQVWLTGGDINTVGDTTPILVVAGTATQNGATRTFTAQITIGTNRQPQTSVEAGGSPICKQRIVPQIPAALTLEQTGGLLLRIDPRLFFQSVDFGTLPTDPQTGALVFPDGPGVTAAQNLFNNLRSIAPYTFTWSEAL